MATITKKKADRITDYIRNNPKLDPEIYRIAARIAVEDKFCLAGCSLISHAIMEKEEKEKLKERSIAVMSMVPYSKLLAMLFCEEDSENSAYLRFKSDTFGELTNNNNFGFMNTSKLFYEVREGSQYAHKFDKSINPPRYGKEFMSFNVKLQEAHNEFVVLRNAISRDYRAFALLFTAEVLEDELKLIKSGKKDKPSVVSRRSSKRNRR